MSRRYSLITAALLGCFVSTPARAEDLPDLTIDRDLLKSSVVYEQKNFPRRDCAVLEGCVLASGKRKLMRFSVRTPNIGTADLVLGDPSLRPDLFTHSACHRHYHFNGYASYELLDQSGTVVLTGRKQAFCLEDFEKWDSMAGAAKFTCSYQGISVGWADTYGSYLDCQWLDITDIRPGNYSLRVTINPDQLLPESNFDNNEATVPVTIPSRIR